MEGRSNLPPELWDIIIGYLSRIKLKYMVNFMLISKIFNEIAHLNPKLKFRMILPINIQKNNSLIDQFIWTCENWNRIINFHKNFFSSDLNKLKFFSSFGLTTDKLMGDNRRAFDRPFVYGCLDICKWILTTYRLDIDYIDSFRPPLSYCIVANGHIELYKWVADFYNFNDKKIHSDCSKHLSHLCESGKLVPLQRLHKTFHLTSEDVKIDDSNPFRRACNNGYIKVCKWLHENFHLTIEDVLSGEGNYYGNSFQCACNNGHLDIAKWIAKTFKLTVEHIRSSDNYALFLACDSGRLAVCKWLVETFNLTINDLKGHNDNVRCVIGAAEQGRLEVLKWFHSTFKFTKKDLTDGNYFTAYQFAANNGHLKVLRWLHSTFELTLDEIKERNNRMLRKACFGGYLKVVKWLVGTFKLTLEDVRNSRIKSEENWICDLPGYLHHGDFGVYSRAEICEWLDRFYKTSEFSGEMKI